MPTMTELRDGLKNRLATISGLRTTATIPDQVNPPIAIVSLDTIAFDQAFRRGLDEYRFTITVVVGRISERTAQTKLDGYLAPTGSTSIKTAIEGDTSLGGKAQTLRVTEMTGLSSAAEAEDIYLTATFSVTVYA